MSLERETDYFLRSTVQPVFVVNLASAEQTCHWKPEDTLTKRIWVARYDGEIPVNLDNADLRISDRFLISANTFFLMKGSCIIR